MYFNSYTFILAFLPLVLLGWWVLFRTTSHRLIFLTLASYVLYGWFDIPGFDFLGLGLRDGFVLLPLLWISTTTDYIAGKHIAASDDHAVRKRWLVAALVFNLSLLGFFKYLGFFEGTVDGILGLLGRPGSVPVAHVILPIGISFYTFNSMSYTIDIYRRKVEPARSALHYAAFVALFPHLIAGPIVRYSDIEMQLRSLASRLTSGMAARGLFFFCCGLFKKVVVADSLAPQVNALFSHTGHLGFISGWSAALGYTMQLYFDFSGYSDMAVGLALLLGFRFPQNFDSPYKAVNISDFWRRWHMSLSSWLRDYLYITLGGSRNGKARTLRNLALTMFLGGLWHGAGWTFVIWGLGHGVLLVGHQLCRDRGFVPPTEWLSRALTFICVVVLWVPFRAHDLAAAGHVLAAMSGLHGIGLHDIHGALVDTSVSKRFILAIGGLLVFVNVAPNTWEHRFVPNIRHATALGFAGASAFLLLAAPSPFLYFQF